MMVENTHIPDLWTQSQFYADLYQNDSQIREVCRLLELSSASSLVDIGCGNGAFAIAAACQFPQSSVVAVDSLSSAVEKTRQRATSAGCQNLDAKVASADALPIHDGSADRVLMRNVAHHLRSLDAAIEEASRVLLPDGIFLLETPCNPGDASLAALISDIHMLMDDSHRRTYHSPAAIADCMEHHQIAASDPECWPYSFPVDDRQIALVKSHSAGEALHLEELAGAGGSIQLTLTRIVGIKKAR